MNRFRVIVGLVLATAFAGCNGTSAIPNRPIASHSAIRHVIIVMQESRSFDNLFAGFPGADTTLAGKCEKAQWCKTGSAKLRPITLESTGRLGLGTGVEDSHHAFEVECDLDAQTGTCRNDGFDEIRYGDGNGPSAKLYPYAYVQRSETKPYWDLAARYALADHFFVTDTTGSFVSHQMILSGTVALNSDESLTDGPDNGPDGCQAPAGTTTAVLHKNGTETYDGPFPCFTQWKTLADPLDAAKVSWKYYVASTSQDISGGSWNGFDAVAKVRCATFTPPADCKGYGADWKAHMSFPNTRFFGDVKSGTLPAVSWLIPTLEDSDHPVSGCNHGPRWVTSVVDAIGRSKYWTDTAIIVFWDNWGGWYDNEPPVQSNYTSLGFRVPLIVISPYARTNYVSNTQYQYGSILKFVEDTFDLGSLHTTDASSNSIADMFDFAQKPAPFANEPLPRSKPCGDALSR